MPPHTTTPPFRHRFQRQRYQLSGGSEDDGGVQPLRRRGGGVARPLRPHLPGELLGGGVARPGEGEDPPALVPGHLRDDVRRRAVAVEPQPLRVTGHGERPVADEPGAQERRGLRHRVPGRDGKGVAVVGHRVLGEAPVDVVAGELGVVAQVLPAAPAVRTGAVGPAQPGHAHQVADRASAVTSGPVLSTTPTIWWPMISGRLCGGSSPSTMWRSVRQTPHACTLIRTCPGPGSGTGTSARRSGPPVASKSMARISSLLRASWARAVAAQAADARLAVEVEDLVRLGHHHLEVQLLLQQPLERQGRLQFPVDEDGQPRRLEVRRPGEQLRLVGVGGQPGDLVDVGLHRDLLAEDAHPLVALQQAPPQRALRLEADDDHVGLGPPQVVLEVVADPPGVGHAARRDDHDAPLAVERPRFVGALRCSAAAGSRRRRPARSPASRPPRRRPPGACGRPRVALRGQRAVHVHRHVEVVLVEDLPQEVEELLRPPHREGRDDDVAAAPAWPA